MTTTAMSVPTNSASANLFQYYLDNYFKFPKEIKNDIIYCQRALKAHIKVHQMVLDVFQSQENADPAQKKRIVNELEATIYEVNAEQHFLFLRLRRVIDEFLKMLKANSIPIDQSAINALISRNVVPVINNDRIEILPINVSTRNSEERLIEKYFEVQKRVPEAAAAEEQKHVYEIIDSDDEQKPDPVDEKPNIKMEVVAKVDLTGDCVMSNGVGLAGKMNNSSHNLAQMSLLKPMAQRIVGQTVDRQAGEEFSDATQLHAVKLPAEDPFGSSAAGFNPITADVKPSSLPAVSKEEPPIELPVSKNVKMSRMNLRQALKRARTGQAAALASAATTVPTAVVSAPKRKTPSPPAQAVAAANVAATVPPTKKPEFRTRATRSSLQAALAASAAAKAELGSSSEDSNPEREPTPPHPFWPHEYEETRTQPEHYGQEMFLRLFSLFTPEMHTQMQQRRSKRKRRTVHSNERADFHYGRIEYGSFPPPEDNKKKRKAFLLSPQVKRGLQSKRPKRGSAEKLEETTPPSRSSSSSPDDKRGCNECLKGGGCLDQCQECKGYYHPTCHREQDEEKPCSAKKAPGQQQSKVKLCPACKRLRQQEQIKKEAQQYKSLHNTAKELEVQMAKEKDRRANLQQEGRTYKVHMRNLFNILNVIKSDQENDSSE